MDATDAARVLSKLRELSGAAAAALVTKDGDVVASDVAPPEAREIIGVLCAAVLGAAGSASGELSLGRPRRIVVNCEAGKLVIIDGGGRLLVMLTEPDGDDTDPVAAETRLIVARLTE